MVNDRPKRTVPSLQSECNTCTNPLTIEDKFKGSDQYWKDCRTCREGTTGSKRKRRAPSTSPWIVATTELTKKKRNTDYNSDAFRQSSPAFSSETQQPASILGPEHTPSPDTVSLLQSNTASNPIELSDESDVEILMRRPQRDFERSRSQSPSQPKMEAQTSMLSDNFALESMSDFHERINKTERAETSNNEASEESSRVVILKLPKQKVCSVCVETLPWQRFPRLADCEHDPDVCNECFVLWLKQQMKSVTNVLCPSSGCSHVITHEDVRKNAQQDVFTRFDELSMRSLLSADKNFLYCYAGGCSSGQIHDSGVEGPIFRCAACGYRMCTAHDPIIPFHENESCTQYNERIAREIAQAEEEERDRNQQEEEARVRREHEAASAAEVAKSSVECPGCGAQIQKTEGCDHMTCRRRGCRFQFCYVCRAPYAGMQGIHRIGNAAHNESCPYHPKKLPTYQSTA